MAVHPLIERSEQREVRQAKGFREAAQALTGESLAAEFRQGESGAPKRGEAGKKYLVAPNKRLIAERKPSRDSDHACLALVNRQKTAERGLLLPDDIGTFEALASGIVLKSAPADKSKGPADSNYGIDKLDIAGIGPDDRLMLGAMRFVAPSGTRVGTGDTPLRAFLEALAHTAVALANREALVAELGERTERSFSDAPPYLMMMGSQRYWELCRKREAQKGAAWIREMERLASEVEEALGITTLFIGMRVNSDPGWSYEDGQPALDGEPRLLAAWEHGAGRVKPKAKPRLRKGSQVAADQLVEPDLSRPVREYMTTDHYAAGDRIEHPKLGVGVVQGIAGVGKIRVNFDDKRSVLVHDRPSISPGA